ncbi:hypothetical protein SEA_ROBINSPARKLES_89 [Gordonia phage RobinSparkles]|nr:hypothetical protein SEA_ROBINSPARKLES_89 [Gordonia phage RobinSparkles]
MTEKLEQIPEDKKGMQIVAFTDVDEQIEVFMSIVRDYKTSDEGIEKLFNQFTTELYNSKLYHWDFDKSQAHAVITTLFQNIEKNRSKLDDAAIARERDRKNLNQLVEAFHFQVDINASYIYDDRAYSSLDNANRLKNIFSNYREFVHQALKSSNERLEFITKALKVLENVDERYKWAINADMFKSGFYVYKDSIFRIRRVGKSRKVEVSLMSESSNEVTFMESPSSMFRKLIYQNPMTQDEVLALCEQYKFCAVCGRKIEILESVKRGIGPVCAEKLTRMDIDTALARSNKDGDDD